MLDYTLFIYGLITGVTSGFFGIGGGSVIVPLLLLHGFVMKEAVAISIMQMVFSSIYGSIINAKRTKGLFRDGIALGIGGTIGGSISAYFLPTVPNIYLQYLFIATLLYTIYALFKAPAVQTVEKNQKSIITLLCIGAFVGIFAMSIGIGGSLMLLPILVRFLKYDLKVATALGLFFVIFSSIGGFISTSIYGHMLYVEGAMVGIGSLIGVYFGIRLKDIVKPTSYKKYVLLLNSLVLLITIYKTFF